LYADLLGRCERAVGECGDSWPFASYWPTGDYDTAHDALADYAELDTTAVGGEQLANTLWVTFSVSFLQCCYQGQLAATQAAPPGFFVFVGIGGGGGAMISDRHGITAGHCVQYAESVRPKPRFYIIMTAGGDLLRARLAVSEAFNADADVACLDVDGYRGKALSLATVQSPKTPVTAWGAPSILESDFLNCPKLAPGYCKFHPFTKVAGVADPPSRGSSTLAHSAILWAGMSGGPILNADGQLVAVHQGWDEESPLGGIAYDAKAAVQLVGSHEPLIRKFVDLAV
jgi:V8-like Glu-specific endopeptidase